MLLTSTVATLLLSCPFPDASYCLAFIVQLLDTSQSYGLVVTVTHFPSPLSTCHVNPVYAPVFAVNVAVAVIF